MQYDDDDYESYYEYDEHIEPVSLVAEYFSEKELTDTLIDAGLIFERPPKYVGNMEKLVFVHGEDSEIYSTAEIRFTEHVHEVFVYSDFYKNMAQGKSMVCRVIAVKIDANDNEAPMDCIFFEKIIDKAFDGFNIFFFIGENSVFFGCRVFDKNGSKDCALSHPIFSEIEFRYMLEELSSFLYINDFLEYYDHMKSAILESQSKMEDYATVVGQRRRSQFSYLDDLEEKNQYWDMLQYDRGRTFDILLEEAFDNLAFVTSNRVNTYELLFEADEMARQMEETEAENNRIDRDIKADNEASDEEIEVLLNDPEKMIKLLKKRRGI